LFSIQKRVLLHSEIKYTTVIMKKIIIAIALFIGVSTVSCKKEEVVQPMSTTTVAPEMLNIEYHIAGVSADMVADYLLPTANGELENVHEVINRSSKIIQFSYPTGHLFSVSAANKNPSHDVVQVEIYVNGQLVAQSSTSNPSQNAIAQGNF
jgi:hypothetical protein